ncbi:MAG: alpha/beta hydrolase [Victivallaceae bacterium]
MINEKRNKIKKRLLQCAVGLLPLVAVLAGGIGCADKIIFQPPESRADFDQTQLDLIDIPQSDGVKLSIYYQPAQLGKPTILYSHGNAEDLSHLVNFLQYCWGRSGYGIAAYDYEGYGRSGGTPSERSVYRDVEAMWRYLTVERKISPDEIIIYGRSVGSGPATYLASRERALGLILEAPFSSAFEVVN